MFVKHKTLVPLTNEERQRITEINFVRVLDALIEKCGARVLANHYIESVARTMGVAPHYMMQLVDVALTDPNIPAHREEIIEIYYRNDYPRREIQKIARCRGSYISAVIEQGNVHIKKCVFKPNELKFIKQFIDFFEKVGGATL